MAPHTRVSRDRQAIKANISTLVGEVINTLPALLLVDGASRDIILNKAMANSSNIDSSESFKKEKRVSKQRQDFFSPFHLIFIHTH